MKRFFKPADRSLAAIALLALLASGAAVTPVAAHGDDHFRLRVEAESESRYATMVGFLELTGGENNIQPNEPMAFYRRAEFSGERHSLHYWWDGNWGSGSDRYRNRISGFQQYDRFTGLLQNQAFYESGSVPATPSDVACNTNNDIQFTSVQPLIEGGVWGPTISHTLAEHDFAECQSSSGIYFQEYFRVGYSTVLSDPDTEADALERATIYDGTSRSTYRTKRTGGWPYFTDQKSRFRVELPNSCSDADRYLMTITYWETPFAGGPSTARVEEREVKATANGMTEYVDVPLKNDHYTTVDEFVWIKKIGGCSSGACSMASQSGGDAGSGGQMKHGSILWSVELGRQNHGSSAGLLHIEEEDFSPALATPAALRLVAGAPGVGVVYSNGNVRQVVAAQATADVVTINNYRYEIRFYYAHQVGAPGAGGIRSLTGSPFVTWRVENPDASPTVYNRLRVTRIRDGVEVQSEIRKTSPAVWVVTEGNGLREITYEKAAGPGANQETVTATARNGSGVVASKTREIYQSFPWGKERVTEILDPDGAALTSTWAYETNEWASGYTQILEASFHDGRIERFTYGSNGLPSSVQRTYLDHSLDTGTVRMEYRSDYATWVGDDYVRIRNTTRSAGSGSVEQRFFLEWPVQRVNGAAFRRDADIRAHASWASWDASDNLREETLWHADGPFINRVKSALHRDGTATVHGYVVLADGSLEITTDQGAPAPHSSLHDLTIADGVRTIRTLDARGYEVSTVTSDIGSGLIIAERVVTQADAMGRPLTVDYPLEDKAESFTYATCGCGQASHTDKDGIVTHYEIYDALGRLQQVLRANIRTVYTRDADGRVLTETRVGTDQTSMLLASNAYDLAGRLTSSQDGLSRTTTFAETKNAQGQTVRTTTFPGGGTRIETYHKDGSLFTVGGTAARPLKYTYDYDWSRSAFVTREIRIGPNQSEAEWSQTFRNVLGQVIRVEHAGGAHESSVFNSRGQRVRSVAADGESRLFQYNARGELEYQVVDMNRNGIIDFNGVDRIVRTEHGVAAARGTTVLQTATYLWRQEGVDTWGLDRVVERAVSGLESWETQAGRPQVEHSLESVVNGLRQIVVTRPDGTSTRTSYSGAYLFQVAERNSGGGTVTLTTYGYDAHGRLAFEQDSRNGQTVYSYNGADEVVTVTEPGPLSGTSVSTSFQYDARGRRTHVTHPDGAVTRYAFFHAGDLEKTWGSRTNPAEYTYDPQGRMKTLRTWKVFNQSTGVGTSGSATTTWHYHPQRGWLTSKVYPDSRTVTYTRDDAGRVTTRAWARGLTTTYGYNNAGQLATVAYSDTTPAVSFTYDRLGRRTGTTDAQGTLTATYRLDHQVQHEAQAFTEGGSAWSTHSYDNAGRRNQFDLTTALGTAMRHSYAYDTAGRLQKATYNDWMAQAFAVRYQYVFLSNLVDRKFLDEGATLRTTTRHSWDRMNRQTDVYTHNTSLVIEARRAYQYNNVNQVTRMSDEWSNYWDYAYDTLGQVTSGRKFRSDGVAFTGQHHQYVHDAIGNRTSTTTNGRAASYTSNAANQYTSRGVPDGVDIFGTAHPDATVTVNHLATTRQNDYFYRLLNFPNTTAARWEAVTVRADLNGILTQTTGNIFLPRTPESYTYDWDGNLLTDGRFTYTYDGENRLTRMETRTGLPTGLQRQRIDFRYDAFGRRFLKIVSNWAGSVWAEVGRERYYYDGWHLVGRQGTSGGQATGQFYLWGTDVSGTRQGAGGVGGLLLVHDVSTGKYYHPTSDANGNVFALWDAATGLLSAQYEYDPFGQTTRAVGVAADVNPFRFSTKFLDHETGLYYYGYRYYSPSMGRWLNRDPIEEQGGLNLYGFVGNDPVNRWDYLGLSSGPVLDPNPGNGSDWRDPDTGRYTGPGKVPGPSMPERPSSRRPGTNADTAADWLTAISIETFLAKGRRNCERSEPRGSGCFCCVIQIYKVQRGPLSRPVYYFGYGYVERMPCSEARAKLANQSEIVPSYAGSRSRQTTIRTFIPW